MARVIEATNVHGAGVIRLVKEPALAAAGEDPNVRDVGDTA